MFYTGACLVGNSVDASKSYQKLKLYLSMMYIKLAILYTAVFSENAYAR